MATTKNAKKAPAKATAKASTAKKAAPAKKDAEVSGNFTTETLTKALATKSGDNEVVGKLSINQSKEIIGIIMDSISEALAAGQKVQLMGYLTISPVFRPEHEGNDVMSGNKMTIPDSVGFNAKVGKKLKDIAKELPAEVFDSIKAEYEAKKAGK